MNFDFLYPGQAIPVKFLSVEGIHKEIDRARSKRKPFEIKIGKKIHKIRLTRPSWTVFQKQPYCMECKMRGCMYILQKNDPSSRNGAEALYLRFYGINEEGEWTMMTIDHRYPSSRGGENDIENLQTMCLPCNRKKGNKLLNKYLY